MKSIKSCASKQGQVSVLFSVLFAPLAARCSCATRCGAIQYTAAHRLLQTRARNLF